jgi:asparagine synthase (glutamine-hydrolysing)
MCGISGFNFANEALIQRMNQELIHRGPDGQSFYSDDNVSIGHTRLSIIDLSTEANQPLQYIHNEHRYSIVFNGEIYNYIELRDKLKLIGYQFRTMSDTEVILASYNEWGEQCIKYFNGMWSFCIYDYQNKTLFLSRDRLGVKPLYYYYQDDVFVFSSEIKAILVHKELEIDRFENINTNAVEMFFASGYIPAPLSIFKNISKLQNGHNLLFDLKSKKIIKNYKYYSFPVLNNSSSLEKKLIEEGKYLLQDSVKLRMRSDVPVGAFLSGGLDSSAIVATVSKLSNYNKFHTFSIGFDDKMYDESVYINMVKDHFKTNHNHYIYSEIDFNTFWPEYSKTFDEPFGDYSSFPTNKVSSMASKDVTVVLSGDGGDEIFGGYPIYNIGYLINNLRKLPISAISILSKISNSIKTFDHRLEKINELFKIALNPNQKFYSSSFSNNRYKPEFFQNFSESKLKEALKLSENNLSEALRIYDLTSNTLSDNYLVKVDRASMKNSIEVRSPFLDYRFIDFSQRIPSHLKVTTFNTKILMKKIIKDTVPKEIINRKKMGFTPPIQNWIYKDLNKSTIEYYLEVLEKLNSSLNLFYRENVIYNEPSYIVNSYFIKLLIFGKWFDYWINKKR